MGKGAAFAAIGKGLAVAGKQAAKVGKQAAKVLFNKKYGPLHPVSPVFKVFTIPLTLTLITTSNPAFRAWSDRQLGTEFEKDGRTSGFLLLFTKDGGMLLGIYEILVQLIVAPLLVASGSPNPKLGKLTFAAKKDIPDMMYTVALLFFARRLISAVLCTDLPVRDKKVKALVAGSCATIGFLFATIIRDTTTPVDIGIPLALTVCSFMVPQFDKVSRFAYGEDFPKLTFEQLFDSNMDDWAAIATTFAVWWGLYKSIAVYFPGFEGLEEAVRSVFPEKGGIDKLIGNAMEFAGLFMLPVAVQRYTKDRPRLGYTTGFAVGMLLKYALPFGHSGSKRGKSRASALHDFDFVY